MEHKCENCYWNTNWGKEPGQFFICELATTFGEAKNKCDTSTPCENYITPEEVERIVETWNSLPND